MSSKHVDHATKMAKERKSLRRANLPNVSYKWLENNTPERILLTIPGPAGSLYERDLYELDITFPEGYPNSGPNVVLKTPIIHPNMFEGAVCINCLRDGFSPAISILQIIDEFQDALSNPNPDAPLDNSAAALYKADFDEFKVKVNEQIMKNIEERANRT